MRVKDASYVSNVASFLLSTSCLKLLLLNGTKRGTKFNEVNMLDRCASMRELPETDGVSHGHIRKGVTHPEDVIHEHSSPQTKFNQLNVRFRPSA